jgi:hypothetical protein
MAKAKTEKLSNVQAPISRKRYFDFLVKADMQSGLALLNHPKDKVI